MEIWDNHFHLDPKGKGVEAVKEFARSGGTAMMAVSKPYIEIGGVGNFQREYEILLSLVKNAREKTGVRIFVALGVHPSRISDFGSLDRAVEVMKGGIDLAAEYVISGKAWAIGEVGRPHYPVDAKTWDASNEIMEYAMVRAHEVGCAVIIHSESAENTFNEIAEIARRAGIRGDRVVKHFSPITDNPSGLIPSVIGTYKNVREALGRMRDFMVESDHIDDPKRPGVVIGPRTLPRTVKKLLEEGYEELNRAMVDLPERVYGIELD